MTVREYNESLGIIFHDIGDQEREVDADYIAFVEMFMGHCKELSEHKEEHDI